ncbi:7-carboxy-7-deazaguanine synthase QueE [Carbonactinospora thermoautotrophica]|uniref:7-carboxy-7-deazaguanine synthase QueE n=1 Tax=Carbonactinospora thermoautotrophica TaxID=1469144 RepID=UPI000B0E881F|nr:7-carboxy-7-deazaguanine synthase QueE [Carbonactinospora thermoautotrophica]
MSAAVSLLLSLAAEESRGLLVAEMFGPTFQGEGPSAGRQAVFVRLSRCNLACSWCDTPYTWDWRRFDPAAEARRIPVREVAAWALNRPSPLVVITGGEPLLQQPRLIDLVGELREAGRRVEIETNGTIPPDPALVGLVDQFNVSPKLASAGGHPTRRIDPGVLRVFVATGKAVFKFVLTNVAEAKEVVELQDTYGLDPIWVMPEGTSAEGVLAGMRELADEALTRGWNLTPRLHVLLWGDTRGR